MHAGLASLVAVGAASTARSQAVVYRWPAPWVGYWRDSNCGVDDLDGDGVRDLLFGEPNDSTQGVMAGRVRLRSGRDGSEITILFGAAGEAFGVAVTPLDDIDGDGVGDFAVSAPRGPTPPLTNPGGHVRVFSGATMALLYQVSSPWAVARHFGATLRQISDVDGDAIGDLLVGADSHNLVLGGAAALVSGANGVILHSWTSPSSWFGSAVDAVGDIDGDGKADVMIGSPIGTGSNYAGTAQIFSSANGALLTTFTGTSEFQGFGASVIGLGDLDGDLVADFAIGCPGCDSAQLLANVYVHSGATFGVLYTLSDSTVLLGGEMRRLGDHDGDGVDEFAVIAWPGFAAAGYVRIVSGRSGATLQQLDGGERWSYTNLAVAGDLNGDGRSDLITEVQYFSSWPPEIERQVILLGAPAPTAYCSAKLNSLSCEPAISSSGAASLVVGDNFVVSASNVLNAKPGVLLWSASPLAAPFAGGALCVAPQPPSIRGPVLDSGGSSANVNDCSGAYAFHFSHALMQSRGLTAGTALYAQFLSRDPGFAAPRNIGLSDALRFFVLP